MESACTLGVCWCLEVVGFFGVGWLSLPRLGASFHQGVGPLEHRDCLLGTLPLVSWVPLEASSWVSCSSGTQ